MIRNPIHSNFFFTKYLFILILIIIKNFFFCNQNKNNINNIYNYNNNIIYFISLSFIDEQFIEKQKQRLQQQSNDLQDIKVAFNQRDNELDAEINVALDFDNSILNEWRYYLSIKHKLNIERKQIEEYIQNANKQLNALQKMSIFNKIKNNC